VDGRAHVQVDQPELVLQLGAGREGPARADAGVQGDSVDRAARAGDAACQLLDPFLGRQVDLHGLDGGP
jgi:hypothetical protein